MPIQFYKILHLIGIFALLLSLGGICVHMINGGSRDHKSRKWLAAMHGVSLLVILVAGFGMLAKLGLMAEFPGWAIAKIVIWLVLGGLPALIYRQKQYAKAFWFLSLLLAAVAATLGVAH